MARARTLTSLLAGVLLCTPFGAAPAAAAPTATPPYTLTTFAVSANGYSQPDSIEQWQDTVLVGFQNHVAKDGSDGKSSTVVYLRADETLRYGKVIEVVDKIVTQPRDGNDRPKNPAKITKVTISET